MKRNEETRDGDVWRMDFSCFNTCRAPAPARDSGSWVWTRHGVWDSPIPECFAFIRFKADGLGSTNAGTPSDRP